MFHDKFDEDDNFEDELDDFGGTDEGSEESNITEIYGDDNLDSARESALDDILKQQERED